MIIRKALMDDIDEILLVANATVDQGYRSWLGDAVVDLYLETDKLGSYLTSHLNEMWLVLKNSKVVGFAICIENMIDYMLVDYQHQSEGIGTKLLAFCEELLFKDYSTVSIESFEKNVASTNFFDAKGWVYVNKYLDVKSQATKLILKKKSKASVCDKKALSV